MGDGFTKLFSSIITSSIWSEDDKTRIMWITMLAFADEDGFVSGAIPGLANIARMSIDDAKIAVEKLMAPDEFSRTKENEGRRIIQVDGGWIIVNYRLYRDRARIENRKEYLRKYQREYMANVRQSASNRCLTGVQLSASASESASLEANEEFLQFWKEYPRKTGKKAAFASWLKAKDRPKIEVIIKALNEQKQSDQWQREDGKFIPMPSTWINQGRWDDEPVEKTSSREPSEWKKTRDAVAEAVWDCKETSPDRLNVCLKSQRDKYGSVLSRGGLDAVTEGINFAMNNKRPLA